MEKYTLDELRETMRVSTGVDESVDLDGDIADTEFAELGYDSLAVLEFVNQVRRKYGVTIPEEAVNDMPTPRKAVEYINNQFAKAGL